jgi:hypothetical protein
VQRREQDRRGHIVRRRYAPGLRRRQRVETVGGGDRQLQRLQGIAQRSAQFIGAGGRQHPARPGKQQRVGKNVPQARQLDADRWLRQVKPLRRPRDVVLAQQHIESAQQIEIQTL